MATLQSTLRVSLLDDVTKRAKVITGSLRNLQDQSSRFVSPLRSLTTQAIAIGGAYLGVTSGFESTYKAAADTQAALTEVGIKSNLSNTQLAQMQRQLVALSPKVNQFSTDLLSGVDVMTTMGASAEQAIGSIPAIGRTATATGAAISELSSASVSAMKNLNVMPAQIQQMLEGMTAAGNAGAFEMKDMAQYFPQLTASAKTLGMSGVPAVNDMAAALQIARRGAGDASTAANNLSDFMGKIVTPQTIKNFKKFGVDVTKELAKANKNGISPIEHFIKLIDQKTKGGRGELLTQIFGDKQTLDFIRPMIAGYQDYLRIRGEADQANGVVAEAYNRRMNDANQKVKSFQISMQNLGTSIGNNLLQPVGQAATYLSDVLNTLDQRVTIFDQVKIASQGFLNGLGFKNGELAKIAADWRDFIFGVQDGSKAADDAGRIFIRFKEWGDNVRYFTDAVANNPIGRFLGDIAPYGVQIAAWSVGIGWLAGAVRGLASALFVLSGASALVSAFKVAKSLAGLFKGAPIPKASVPPKSEGVPPKAGSSRLPEGRPGSSGPWGRVPRANALPEGTRIGPTGPKISAPIEVTPRSIIGGIKGTLLTALLTELGTRGIRAGMQSYFGDKYVEPPDVITGMQATFAAWKDLIVGKDATERKPDALSNRSSNRDETAQKAIPSPTDSSWLDLLTSKRFWIGDAADPNFSARQHFAIGSNRKVDAVDDPAKPAAGLQTTDQPVRISAESIAQMLQKSGTQDVRVTNPQPPNVTIHAPISIYGVSDPKAAAGAAASDLGQAVKSAVEGSFSD